MAVRAFGVLAVLMVSGLTLGPFQGAEGAFGLSDKAAHMVAFYGLTILAFIVAPSRRRTDLAIIVLTFGLAIEIAQGLSGRSTSLSDFMADMLGVAFATLPGLVERLRHNARTNPYMTFANIARSDRRRHSARPADVSTPAGLLS